MWQVILAAAVSLAAAGGGRAPRAPVLSAAEIKTQILDKTFDWHTWDRKTGTIVFKSDGNFIATLKEGSEVSEDAGTWSMQNNQICMTWSLIFMRYKKCFGFVAKGSGKYHAE